MSVAIFDDKRDGTQHVLLEARQGSFLLQHFMGAQDARSIGIALLDAGNEVELGEPWREARPLSKLSEWERAHDLGDHDTNSPHPFAGRDDHSTCYICGRNREDTIHDWRELNA